MVNTPLTPRAILMVVLFFVMLMGGMMATVFIVAPGRESPAETWRMIAISAIIALLALAWFVRLAILAVRDRRRGVQHGPAKVGGWFHVCFGAAVAIGGGVCSLLTYQAAVMAGGGTWKLFWGMVAWGILEALYGLRKVSQERADEAARDPKA